MAGINFDFTTGSLPGAITFTRASAGTYNSSGNILTTASSNVARFNFVAGVANLLIEPAATNLLVASNNFSDASWLSGGSPVITGAQFISPDGTNTGWSMTSGIGNGVIYQVITYLSNPYTMSIWAKRIIGSAPIELLIDGASSGNIVTSATLTRFSFTGTTSDTTGTAIRLPVPSGSTNGIYGVQLETGSKATSYISTTTAAVTRAADSAMFTVPAGITLLKYTFDDNSTQTVNVTPGSYTIPTNLSRPNIKSIQSVLGYDFTSGSLPAGITFTRASIGTYFNNVGTLITASNNVARFNYIGGVSNLLIEGSATNLLVQSNAFLTTWIPFSAGVATAAQFVSPDGTNDGWAVTSGSGYGGVQQTITYSGGIYTASVWQKWITGSNNVAFTMFNQNSPSFTASVTAARYSWANTPAVGSGNLAVKVDNGSGAVNGVYGAQVEAGSVATSYIPTTTAATVRAADSATFTIPAGVSQLTYTFDDNSTQVVSVSPGSYTIPTNLNRSNLKSIIWVQADNPVPTITSLSPSSVTAGTGALTLTVNGTNFVTDSVVNWNGAARTTTYVSATQLTAAILAGDVVTAGTASVTVFNTTPGGGTSGVSTFTINAANNPVPAITSLAPNATTAGSGALTLTVNGTNFISTSVVNWNGAARTTAFVSATQLTAAILAGDVATAGTASVTVFSPTPGGGTSGASTFTINAVAPSGGVITLQCAACGFYMKTTNPHDANIIAAKHTAGWGPAHVVSVN